MEKRNRNIAMVLAIVGGPLLTFAAAAVFASGVRPLLRTYGLPLVLIVVLVSVVIYQVSMAILTRMTGRDR
ncbi:MAG: hypothetical protein JJ913_02600 [Rhizobiaceae bacterium]|nr:hypothetical protein [Rhizobiaceae bacterium]